jgi:hypothetical protein
MEVYVVLDSKGMFVFSLDMPVNKRHFGAEDAARACNNSDYLSFD